MKQKVIFIKNMTQSYHSKHIVNMFHVVILTIKIETIEFGTKLNQTTFPYGARADCGTSSYDTDRAAESLKTCICCVGTLHPLFTSLLLKAAICMCCCVLL